MPQVIIFMKIRMLGMGVYPTNNLAEAFEEGDPTREWTILFPGEEFAGFTFTGLDMQDPNWAVNGLDHKKAVIPQPDLAGNGDKNFVVIRHAEMLLNLAEAENELNGPSGAYDPINRIRNRVGLPDLPAGMTQEEMRNATKHERRVELAFEGHHYFDLLRWGPEDMKAAMESVVEPGHTSEFSPRVMLWPIPQSEIDVNPNLTQNPEW